MRRFALTLTLAGCSLAVIVAYLALGGLDFKPTPPKDPCKPATPAGLSGDARDVQAYLESALSGAACSLHVPREELFLALADPKERTAFEARHGLSDARVQKAAVDAVDAAIAKAESDGTIDSFSASLLRGAVEFLPLDQLLRLAAKQLPQ